MHPVCVVDTHLKHINNSLIPDCLKFLIWRGSPTEKTSYSVRNSHVHLTLTTYPDRDAALTVCHQLRAALHNQRPHLSSIQLATKSRHIITYNAHCLPSALSFFLILGSAPCNLYLLISFDKLHVVDLGIIRQLCDISNKILSPTSLFALSHVMIIANQR